VEDIPLGFQNSLTPMPRLDLTAASVAYLLEPQWNPMMEEQALCRIHRLGQTKEVKTIRYRIKGSFEEVCRINGNCCLQNEEQIVDNSSRKW
jgi:hypothetical protein